MPQGAQPGFAEECQQLYAAEQYEKLLDKFVSALDVVLGASSSDQGAPPARPPPAHAHSRVLPFGLGTAIQCADACTPTLAMQTWSAA